VFEKKGNHLQFKEYKREGAMSTTNANSTRNWSQIVMSTSNTSSITSLQNEIKVLKTEQDDAIKRNKSVQKSHSIVHSQIRDINNISSLQDEIKALKTERDDSIKRNKIARSIVHSQIRDIQNIPSLQNEIKVLKTERDDTIQRNKIVLKLYNDAKLEIQKLQRQLVRSKSNNELVQTVRELITTTGHLSINSKRKKNSSSLLQQPSFFDQMRYLTPKHRLKTYYDKVHSMQLSNGDYYTWGNGKDLAQCNYFTSFFLCPNTGIVFSSNHREAAATTTTDDIDVYWYSSCKKAEHSAAARAYNYWLKHSDKPTTTAIVLALPIPSTCIPKCIFDEIIYNQQQIILSRRIMK